MKIVPNPTRTPLHSGDLPMGDVTPRQRALIEAVRGCHALADFRAAPRRIVTTVEVADISLGYSRDGAADRIKSGLERAKAKLEHIEAVFMAYGPSPFMPAGEGVPCPPGPFATKKDVLVAVLRYLTATDQILVRAGDTPVTRDVSGAYVLDSPAPVAVADDFRLDHGAAG